MDGLVNGILTLTYFHFCKPMDTKRDAAVEKEIARRIEAYITSIQKGADVESQS